MPAEGKSTVASNLAQLIAHAGKKVVLVDGDLRNPSLTNFLDRCAISIPCHREGEAPVGLMLVGETMGDARLFRIAAAVEAALAA